MEEAYVATVQILTYAASAEDADDIIHGLLQNAVDDSIILDWAYFKFGGQFAYPTDRVIRSDYGEGEFVL